MKKMRRATIAPAVLLGCLFALLPVEASGHAQAGSTAIDPALQEQLGGAEPEQIVSVLAFLHDQGDIERLHRRLRVDRADRRTRNREVVRTLRDTADLSQRRLVAHLQQLQRVGRIVRFEPMWIANCIRIDAAPEEIEALALHPDVKHIFHNAEIEPVRSVGDEPNAARRRNEMAAAADVPPLNPGGLAGAVPPGIAAVNAPDVWAMGIQGSGVVVASLDSGVDGAHPALGMRWRGHAPGFTNHPQWSWFDPVTNTTQPTEFDQASHGTHTMGTILGGAPGQSVGVAPKAQWIHAAVIDRVDIPTTAADAMLALQWVVDPDGDPDTVFDVPQICSNAWGLTSSHGYPECDQLFWSFLDNAQAAGVLMLFAAGNEGVVGLRRPADRATDAYRSFAVGAIDPHQADWPVPLFSSRGPTFCTAGGSEATKPDLAAPGVSILSSIKNGAYATRQGTSMAVPHVAGVAALMLEACPELTPETVIDILIETAVDLGTPGKNNQTGHGMVDAHAAVLQAINGCGIRITLPDGAPVAVAPGESVTFEVHINETNETLVPESAVLMVRTNRGPFVEHPLAEIDQGVFQAELFGRGCGDTLEFFVRAEGSEGSVRTVPASAPEELLLAEVGVVVDGEVFGEGFQNGLPANWSASGLWAIGQSCPVPGECPAGDGDDPDATPWAYYGQPSTCTYDTGSQTTGDLISAPITLPQVAGETAITLEFCYALETEGSPMFDRALFSVAGGQETQLPDAFLWTTYTEDLTAYAGQTIQLRWRFDSIDGVLNNFRGWHVKNVRITGGVIACEEPTCPADLNRDGAVNVLDLLELLGAWGACADECPADLTRDGVVNVLDLLELLGAWGPCE